MSWILTGRNCSDQRFGFGISLFYFYFIFYIKSIQSIKTHTKFQNILALLPLLHKFYQFDCHRGVCLCVSVCVMRERQQNEWNWISTKHLCKRASKCSSQPHARSHIHIEPSEWLVGWKDIKWISKLVKFLWISLLFNSCCLKSQIRRAVSTSLFPPHRNSLAAFFSFFVCFICSERAGESERLLFVFNGMDVIVWVCVCASFPFASLVCYIVSRNWNLFHLHPNHSTQLCKI